MTPRSILPSARLALAACALAAITSLDAAESIDPLAYPLATELHLGSVPVRVLPARHHRVISSTSGRLHLTAGFDAGRLEDGQVWAEFDPDRLRLEREAFELAGRLLEEKEKPGFRLEQSEARVQLENRLVDMQRQEAMLAKIVDEPELSALYLQEEGHGAGDAATIRLMRDRLAAQIDLMSGALTYVGTPRQAELELQILDLKMRQQQLDLERREQESRLKAPFAGELRWSLALPENYLEDGIPVESGAEIATLVDHGRMQVRMVMRRLDWRVLPVNALVLRFRTSSIPRPLEARFTQSGTSDVMGREELIYDFQFEPDDVPHARPLVGGTLMAELHADLGREVRVIPKMDIVIAAPATFRDHGWVDAIPRIAPGWRAHMIGQSELALIASESQPPPDEP